MKILFWCDEIDLPACRPDRIIWFLARGQDGDRAVRKWDCKSAAVSSVDLPLVIASPAELQVRAGGCSSLRRTWLHAPKSSGNLERCTSVWSDRSALSSYMNCTFNS